MTRDEIFDKVQETLVDALGVDDDEVVEAIDAALPDGETSAARNAAVCEVALGNLKWSILLPNSSMIQRRQS